MNTFLTVAGIVVISAVAICLVTATAALVYVVWDSIKNGGY